MKKLFRKFLHLFGVHEVKVYHLQSGDVYQCKWCGKHG